MSDNSHPNLDDELASFTDKVLRGEQIEHSSSDASSELGELQDTVHWLSGTLGHIDPDAEMAGRIRRRLLTEWKATMGTSQPEIQSIGSWWKRWLAGGEAREDRWRSTRKTQQVYGVVLAGIAIILLLFFVSTDFTGLGGTAAAGGSLAVALIGAGLGLIIGVGVWLALRRK